MNDLRARWWRASGTGGAVSVIGLVADEASQLDAALEALSLPRVPVNGVRWCRVAGVDEMVVARSSARLVWLTPHAGKAIAERIDGWLSSAGLECAHEPAFPEARSAIETRALGAVTRAASPRAVDLLLRQHELWSMGERDEQTPLNERDRGLRWLIEPPMVVVVGRPNAGKSTLLNAVAGQTVALATEVAGTTLDHVGALIELDGLVVRWVDTPGIEDHPSDELQASAQQTAAELASSAELVVRIAEATRPEDIAELPTTKAGQTRTLASKTDLAAGGGWTSWADLGCSALDQASVLALATDLRRAFVNDAWLASDEPWRFWGD